MKTLIILTLLSYSLISQAAPFEIEYRQQAYRTPFPLQWRTVTDTQEGHRPNWDNINQIQLGMSMPQVRELLGEPWHLGNSYLTEWNYLYRYTFSGNMQQCQYKIVFDSKTQQVKGMFWEPVAQAHCRH